MKFRNIILGVLLKITIKPIGGTPLFKELPKSLKLEHLRSGVLLNQIVQDSYKRKRDG